MCLAGEAEAGSAGEQPVEEYPAGNSSRRWRWGIGVRFPTGSRCLPVICLRKKIPFMSDGISRSSGPERGRGRPPGVDTSGRLTIQMRPATKARLELLGALQRRPLWQIVDSALLLYISTLPEAVRHVIESSDTAGRSDRPTTAVSHAGPERQWVSLAEFVGSGEFGGSSMSRLTTAEIIRSAKTRGIDPRPYLDGTRAGRNRLELAIRHRSEVLEALVRGESIPDVALAAYPDLASAKQKAEIRGTVPRRSPNRTSDRWISHA